jgi:two-component system, OmpR family, sensor histidine kinase CiaH
MFDAARLKLTTWYLLIITVISIFFSVAIYRTLTGELDRVERIQELRLQRGLPERLRYLPFLDPNNPSQPMLILDPDLVAETKHRILFSLIIIDAAILAASTLVGYFLAGRTLDPIKEMVDEQNRFVTDASHELRTPLTSLKSEIEVNLRDKKLTLKDAKKILESNLEEVNNLQNLSDSLIKFTQYPIRTNDLSITKLSAGELLMDVTKKVAPIAKHKHITITNTAKDAIFDGNKTSLTEVFVILLENAVKYSKENSTITLGSEHTENRVRIYIQDEGIGIEDKDIPHVFDRFYRADKSRTKTDIPGYGLGLAIAKQMVEKHFGAIKVKSKVGVGSTFTVELPVQHIRS